MSSDRNNAALSGSRHSSRISESLRVARMPSTSQFASTLRPSASRGTSTGSRPTGPAAPSGWAITRQ